jgi:tRNA dimethylallyltransferase
MGATATGKSELGVALALRFPGEIISMDSRQVYRGMDVGTGKITKEEMGSVPHHLIDVLDPNEFNSAGQHAAQTRLVIQDVVSRGNTPFLVGGTGLYFNAIFHPMIEVALTPDQQKAIRSGLETRDTASLYEELGAVDPARARELSPNDRVRIVRALEVYQATGKPQSEHFSDQRDQDTGYEFLKIVLTLPRQMLRDKIADRTRHMFDGGWAEEVGKLLAAGYSVSDPGMNSLGYQNIAEAVVTGAQPRDTVDAVITRTHQYAKRQETFFRKHPDAAWYGVSRDDYPEAVERAVEVFLHPE